MRLITKSFTCILLLFSFFALAAGDGWIDRSKENVLLRLEEIQASQNSENDLLQGTNIKNAIENLDDNQVNHFTIIYALLDTASTIFEKGDFLYQYSYASRTVSNFLIEGRPISTIGYHL